MGITYPRVVIYISLIMIIVMDLLIFIN